MDRERFVSQLGARPWPSCTADFAQRKIQLTPYVVSLFQLLFTASVILFWGDSMETTGLDSGHWVWGTILYLMVLFTVLGKAALVSEYVMFSPARIVLISSVSVFGRSTR